MDSCNLCGSTDSRVISQPQDYITGEVFRLMNCGDCGLVFVSPQPGRDDLARYYPTSHQASEPAMYERMDAKPRIEFVHALQEGRPGRVLDIGCGKGLLLAGLKERGWDVTGVELSENSASVAASLGVRVLTQPLEVCRFDPAGFDVITMYHSLEHMTDPRGTLRLVRTLISSSGHLVIEVPNYGSWHARLFGDQWFHLDVPRHLYHFSRRTLTSALARTGWHAEDVQTANARYDAFGIVQSILNKLLTERNLLNSFNTGEVTWSEIRKGPRAVRRFAALVVSQGLLAIGFPLALAVGAVAGLFTEGGTLRIVCRPWDGWLAEEPSAGPS